MPVTANTSTADRSQVASHSHSGTVANIAVHLQSMAQLQPSQPAVFCPRKRDRNGKVAYTQYTFQQLHEVSNRLASGFDRAGITRGMRTVLMAPPSLEFFALTFALFKLGAVPVLIDPGIGIANLGKCIDEADPEAFIGIAKAHLARIVLGWGRGKIKRTVIVGKGSLLAERKLAEIETLGGDHGEFEIARPNGNETAAILFTSGSTGVPKGVVYTHQIFGEQVEHIRRLYGIQPGEIDLPTFPLFALFGPALGMTAVIPEMDPTRPANVDPVKIIEAIEKFGITNMFGSPALINRVGRHGEANGVRLPTLRRVISAGAPVPAKALERFAKMLTEGVQVFTPYGATECLPVSSIGSKEILGETRAATDQGRGVCVGMPVMGLDLKVIKITDEPIAAWSDDLEVARGEIGEIAVKGLHVTTEYFRREVSTRLAKIRDSRDGRIYHRMGDVGNLDELGRIWFCGRKSHRVVTAKGTLFTIPCEAVFNTHASVYRTALVGVNSAGGMEPVLCVELEPNAKSRNQDELRKELLEIGARFEHTRAIQTILFHPAFPVDIRHNAKIFREKLAVWAAKRLG